MTKILFYLKNCSLIDQKSFRERYKTKNILINLNKTITHHKIHVNHVSIIKSIYVYDLNHVKLKYNNLIKQNFIHISEFNSKVI